MARAAFLFGTAASAITAVEAAQDVLRADSAHSIFPGSITDDLATCNNAIGDGGYRDCLGGNSPHLSLLGLTVHGQRWHDAILSRGGFPVAVNAATQVAGTAIAQLAFKNPLTRVSATGCGLLTLATLSSTGAAAAPTANLTVTLSVAASGAAAATYYADPACTLPTTTATVFAGTAATAFYVMAAVPSTQVLTAAGPATGNIASAKLSLSITLPFALALTGPTKSSAINTCVPLTLNLADSSGAAASLSTTTLLALAAAGKESASFGNFFADSACSNQLSYNGPFAISYNLTGAATNATVYFQTADADTFKVTVSGVWLGATTATVVVQ